MPQLNEHLKSKVVFMVPPEVHLLDLAGPAHVFYEAVEHHASFDLHFASLKSSQEEESSAGLYFNKLQDVHELNLSEHDIVFIPGLESHLIFNQDFIQSCEPFFNWLGRQHDAGAKLCSVCTGAYILAEAGLLNHRECTTHWKYLDDFRKRFPEVQLHSDRFFVKDGNIYSSAGVSSGIDLALYLLEELYDPILATKVAKEIVIYLRRAEDDPQLSVFLQHRNHIENRVHRVQDHLAQHLAQKQKIDDLADLVNMSPRNLTRLFRKSTGITIGEYHDKLRVERAVQLLTDGQKVEVVSQLCGLSTNQLRSILKKHTDLLPSELS